MKEVAVRRTFTWDPFLPSQLPAQSLTANAAASSQPRQAELPAHVPHASHTLVWPPSPELHTPSTVDEGAAVGIWVEVGCALEGLRVGCSEGRKIGASEGFGKAGMQSESNVIT